MYKASGLLKLSDVHKRLSQFPRLFLRKGMKEQTKPYSEKLQFLHF